MILKKNKKLSNMITEADKFEQAIRDFGIEAALEYFDVKEADKQFFRNELSKRSASTPPSISDDKVTEQERMFTRDVVEFVEWLHLNKCNVYQTPDGLKWKTAGYSDKTTLELLQIFKRNQTTILP